MTSRIDTYSSFKGLVIPVLSALTLSADNSYHLDDHSSDLLPLTTHVINIEQDAKSYSEQLVIRSSETVEINSDIIALQTIKSFAENYLKNLKPIEESIQAVIDDFFWEMI